MIWLVVSSISNPFYAELARGIEDKAHEQGYNVIFCSTENKPERTETYVHLMMDAGVDGFIFASSRLHEPVVEKLIDELFPLVLVNRKLKGEKFNYVVLNNFKGAYEITEHLINLGLVVLAIDRQQYAPAIQLKLKVVADLLVGRQKIQFLCIFLSSLDV